MGLKKVWFGGAMMLLLLGGCGDSEKSQPTFEADTFSKDDMCITRIADHTSLCYGDAKSDVEQTLGSATEEQPVTSTYSNGVAVFYRDGKAVGFSLREGSQGVYATARGAQHGMPKSEMMELYGSKYANEMTEFNLGYAYDTKTGKLVDKELFMSKEQQQLKEQIFFVSAMFDGNDNKPATNILLADLKMAIFLE